MTVSSDDFLKAQYGVSKGLGDRSLSSDALFVIEGFEYLSLLIKSFPWPVTTSEGEVEISLPAGQKHFQRQQIRTAFQGQVVLTETAAGHAEEALNVLARQKNVNATVFEGTITEFTRVKRIKDVFFVIDPAERDHESRTQVTQFSGTIFFNYFGESEPGTAEGVAARAASAIGRVRG